MLEQVLEHPREGPLIGIAEWVRCHQPANLGTTITLTEDHLASECCGNVHAGGAGSLITFVRSVNS